MLESTTFMDQNKFEKLRSFKKNSIAISIGDPMSKWDIRGQDKYAGFLRLEFHDINQPVKGYIAFNESHMNALKQFLDLFDEYETWYKVIVHCQAGISRSPAIALWASKYYHIEFKPPYSFELANQYVLHILNRDYPTVE